MSRPRAAAAGAPLRFVVALDVEARPVIERFGLEPESAAGAFKIFRRGSAALVVSGIGKVAAGAATAFLHRAAGGEADAVWLNVGIAGHGTRPVGEALLAHKVVDRASGEAWYPPLAFEPPCATDVVTTVDRPEREMAAAGAFDMEASGFVATARRFASAELVQCLKVVSDSPDSGFEGLTPASVQSLVARRLTAVEAVAEACGELALELRRLDAEPPELDACLERWRFTVTERHELRRLLRRRRTLAPDQALPLDGVAESARGGEVNRRLREWLDELPVDLEAIV